MKRFEAERQALALMDHPNIAKVLDAGTADGWPFFVMELVKGVPLTDYCDGHRLTVHQRLELFRQICGAIQHAHQKGVIHRDLKPSNVLVGERDEEAAPKVIDFGLAKATGDARLADQTHLTGIGVVIGTPAYMAPEQATLGAEDVDTRADIYALGVILYELLTGTTPVSEEALRTLSVDQLLRVIREEDPPTPSDRLAREPGAPAVAAARGTDTARLVRTIHGDLGWVVMKALAKDRERRYESAAALGQDVARFLANEPVAAGPPSVWYRARKFARRHTKAVAVAAAVFLSLTGAVVGTSYGLAQAREQEAAARKSANEERTAKNEALRRADQFSRISDVLAAMFAKLDPNSAEKDGLSLRQAVADRLLAAADQLDAEAERDPMAVAVLQHRLGMSLNNLGFPERAIPLHEKAGATLARVLGPDAHETLASHNSLAEAYRGAGRFADSVRLHEATLEQFKAQLGPDHSETLTIQGNLAQSYARSGREADAIRLHTETLRQRRAVLAEGHPDIANSLNNLATVHLARGRYVQAIPLLEESLKVLEAAHGRKHPATLGTMSNLAFAYWKIGRARDAVPIQEETLAAQRVELGQDHPETLISMNHLGELYRITGRPKDGFDLLEDCYRRSITRLGSDNPETVTRRGNLARACIEAGRGADAVPLFAAYVPAQRKKYGAGTPALAGLLTRISVDLMRTDQFAAAEPYLRESLAIKQKAEPNSWETADARSLLGESLLGQNRLDDAGPLLEAGYRDLKARATTIPPALRRTLLEKALDRLTRHAEATRQPTDRWRAERATLPPELAPPPRPAASRTSFGF
jgi:tetratricopeptide (TPR) repeat protein